MKSAIYRRNLQEPVFQKFLLAKDSSISQKPIGPGEIQGFEVIFFGGDGIVALMLEVLQYVQATAKIEEHLRFLTLLGARREPVLQSLILQLSN